MNGNGHMPSLPVTPELSCSSSDAPGRQPMLLREDSGLVVEDDGVKLNDAEARNLVLDHMNTLRRTGKFCDVVLRVGRGSEITAHRSVLAAASPYFDAAFSRAADGAHRGGVGASSGGSLQRAWQQPVHDVDGIELEAFELLLNYAYTGRLCVAPPQVKAVYQGAIKLQMRQAAEACSRHLSVTLNAANCLDIHTFADGNYDKQLVLQTEQFIRCNFKEVKGGRGFTSVPTVKVNIYGADADRLAASDSQHVCQLVVDWVASTLESQNTGSSGDIDRALESLCSHEHLLYVTADNHLRDCVGVEEDTELGRSDRVVDYKKMARRQQSWNAKTEMFNGSRHSNLKDLSRVIASEKDPQTGYSYVCLAVMGGEKLMVASLHFCTSNGDFITDGSSSANGLASPMSPSSSSSSSGDEWSGMTKTPTVAAYDLVMAKQTFVKPSSFMPLATMSVARCGVGLAALADGKLVAVGGHDRGECLDTVEAYNCENNSWSPMPSMNTPRGRFECEQIQGRLYACGGSDGRRELDSAECYDPQRGRWTMLTQPMAARKSNAGVGVLHDRLYVIGGWSGQGAERSCELYDPALGSWQFVAPLNVGRSQAAVCSFGESLYAFGGQDSWTCFNTAEVYDRRTNRWQLLTPMPACSRGAGVSVYRGKMYLVGGSNGSSALRATHVYDPLTDAWSEGPPLVTRRVNVGVSVCGGDGQLYAVGGFSGKEFLNSVERLNVDDGSEWCSYAHNNGWASDDILIDK